MADTITDADVTAAVTKALAEAKSESDSRIADLEAKLADREASDQIADLQRQVDEAVAMRKHAEDTLADTVAFLAAEAAAVQDAARVEAAKAERVKAVKDLAIFPEAHIEANADRWAVLDADQWAAQLADYEAIAPVAPVTDTAAAVATPVVEPVHSPLGGAVITDSVDSEPFLDVLANRHAVLGTY